MRPMNQIAQRFRIKPKFSLSDKRDEFSAGLAGGIEKLLSRLVRAKVSFVIRREKCRLVMIEPPGQLFRRRILKIDDRVFIAVKHIAFEQEVPRPMQQSAIFNARVVMNSFEIKTRERGRRGNAVETMSVIQNAKFHSIEESGKKPVILTIVGSVSQPGHIASTGIGGFAAAQCGKPPAFRGRYLSVF